MEVLFEILGNFLAELFSDITHILLTDKDIPKPVRTFTTLLIFGGLAVILGVITAMCFRDHEIILGVLLGITAAGLGIFCIVRICNIWKK